MKAAIAILAGTALAGCATTAQMQAKAPDATFTSSKSIPALEECLAMSLSWLGNPSIIRGPERTVLAYGNPNPALTLAIVGSEPASVEVRASLTVGGRVRRNVEACL